MPTTRSRRVCSGKKDTVPSNGRTKSFISIANWNRWRTSSTPFQSQNEMDGRRLSFQLRIEIYFNWELKFISIENWNLFQLRIEMGGGGRSFQLPIGTKVVLCSNWQLKRGQRSFHWIETGGWRLHCQLEQKSPVHSNCRLEQTGNVVRFYCPLEWTWDVVLKNLVRHFEKRQIGGNEDKRKEICSNWHH